MSKNITITLNNKELETIQKIADAKKTSIYAVAKQAVTDKLIKVEQEELTVKHTVVNQHER